MDNDIYQQVADHITRKESPAPTELSRGIATLNNYADLEAKERSMAHGYEERLRRDRSLIMDNSDLQSFLHAEFEDRLTEDESAIRSAIRLLRESKELPLSKDWMETQSGLAFAPLDEDPQYALADLVWGCARMCRFAGQISPEHEHYSVAEHLVLLTRWLMQTDDPEIVELMPDTPAECRRVLRTLAAHDLQEGLVQDMVRPMKRQDPFYRKVEDRLSAHMARRWDLIFPLPSVVKLIDNRALVDERAQALRPSGLHWGSIEGMKPLGIELQFWSPRRAAEELFRLLEELGGFAD